MFSVDVLVNVCRTGDPVRRRFSGFGPKPASHGFAVGTPVDAISDRKR
jgi:hypothetical protein